MHRMTMTLASACLALAATPAGAQQSDNPEAVEERRAVGFVRALKSADTDTVLQFVREHFAPATWERRSPEEWRRMADQLIRRLGPMEIQGVEITQPHTLNLILGTTDAQDAAATLGFEFQSAAPYRIAGISVKLGGPGEGRDNSFPPFEPPANADRKALTKALERYFADLAQADRFSGTALVAYHGEVIFTAAHGLASKRFNAPNRLDTRFDLGSINKAFTKVATGQLLEAGKLSLDDRITDRLPDYPNREVAEQVTIQQLLEHTSGLGDMFNDKFQRSSRALYRSPRDYFALFADEPLLFAPGTGRQYSNAGYIVLGAIIEAVSGEPYDEYIKRHIFKAAAMKRSGFFERDAIEPNIAEGYTRWIGGGEERKSNVFRLPIKGNPAGSAQSTVQDLLRFDTALREHKLLSPPYTAWFFGSAVPAAGASGSREPVSDGLGIAGGGPGVSAVLESDGTLLIVILSNYDPPGAEAIAQRLQRPLARALRR